MRLRLHHRFSYNFFPKLKMALSVIMQFPESAKELSVSTKVSRIPYHIKNQKLFSPNWYWRDYFETLYTRGKFQHNFQQWGGGGGAKLGAPSAAATGSDINFAKRHRRQCAVALYNPRYGSGSLYQH